MRLISRYGIPVALASLVLIGCTPTDATPPSPAATGTGADAAMDDDRVSTYVRARFHEDDAIRASDIDVAANGGAVTLRGTVPDEKTRQHAVAVAREVSGVRQVNDNLVVGQPPSTIAGNRADTAERPDSDATMRQPGWITTKIQSQYFINPEIRPWNIDVTTSSQGVVTLEGTVEDAADRTEAERIARTTEGVTQVNNRLRVRSETAANAPRQADTREPDGVDQPDAWVTAKIQSKYFLDSEVKGRNIDVDTSNGVVTLTGEVETESQRRQALALARNTEGVTQVNDRLAIRAEAAANADRTPGGTAERPATTVDDAWVTTKIESKYFLDADVKGRDIDVTTTNGVVTLEGTVASDAEKQAAESIARETDGVLRVNNRLTVAATDKQR